MANAIVVVESKLADVAQKKNVAANTHVGEAETCIVTTEDMLQHTQEALASAAKRIAYPNRKIWKIEAEERICEFLACVNELN